MFLDVERFTPFAATREPAAVAVYLSDLFATVGPLIEAAGGVIDKCTGDGLLAFWDAPENDPDHTAPAIGAASAIAGARDEMREDEPRLRVGIHTGPVVVGEMGFEGRLDYTLTGETVNTAERTQQAVRGLRPDRRTVIGATAATLEAAGSGGKADSIVVVDPDEGRAVAAE